MAKSKKLNRETVPRAQLGSDTKVNAQLESWTCIASQEQLRLVRRKIQLWGPDWPRHREVLDQG